MALTATPILGGAYEATSLLFSAQRAVNLFAELADTKDGKTPGALYGTPGLKPILSGDNLPWRKLHTTGKGVLYGVNGRKVYQVTGAWTLVQVGLLVTERGPVSMVDNSVQFLLVDGDSPHAVLHTVDFDVGGTQRQRR